MAHLDYVDPESSLPAVQSLLRTDEETYGRPSLFARVMAHHPGLLEARQQYTEAVVEEGGLDPTLVELVTVAVSGTNDCAYCVASHVEHLIEQLGVDEDRARAVARGDYEALDSRERAGVELAAQIARDPARVGPEGIDRLRTVGFEDHEIVAIVTTCAMAVSANVIAAPWGSTRPTGRRRSSASTAPTDPTRAERSCRSATRYEPWPSRSRRKSTSSSRSWRWMRRRSGSRFRTLNGRTTR